jgi:hypothetical protein
MRRDLVAVRGGDVIGSVTLDGDQVTFDRFANDALAGMRRDLGDLKTGRQVMADGWSNGYAYFTEVQP